MAVHPFQYKYLPQRHSDHGEKKLCSVKTVKRLISVSFCYQSGNSCMPLWHGYLPD